MSKKLNPRKNMRRGCFRPLARYMKSKKPISRKKADRVFNKPNEIKEIIKKLPKKKLKEYARIVDELQHDFKAIVGGEG